MGSVIEGGHATNITQETLEPIINQKFGREVGDLIISCRSDLADENWLPASKRVVWNKYPKLTPLSNAEFGVSTGCAPELGNGIAIMTIYNKPNTILLSNKTLFNEDTQEIITIANYGTQDQFVGVDWNGEKYISAGYYYNYYTGTSYIALYESDDLQTWTKITTLTNDTIDSNGLKSSTGSKFMFNGTVYLLYIADGTYAYNYLYIISANFSNLTLRSTINSNSYTYGLVRGDDGITSLGNRIIRPNGTLSSVSFDANIFCGACFKKYNDNLYINTIHVNKSSVIYLYNLESDTISSFNLQTAYSSLYIFVHYGYFDDETNTWKFNCTDSTTSATYYYCVEIPSGLTTITSSDCKRTSVNYAIANNSIYPYGCDFTSNWNAYTNSSGIVGKKCGVVPTISITDSNVYIKVQ